jgi:hypothetical protein
MTTSSRELRGTVLGAATKVGLVLTLAVLTALLVLIGAPGLPDGSEVAASTTGAPSTAGLVLALLVLGAGVSVLAVGAARGEPAARHQHVGAAGRRYSSEPHPAAESPLVVGFSLTS